MQQTGTTINVVDVIDSRRAATVLGLAEQTLRKMRITGGGPPYLKLNRSVRYRLSDLQAWLDERVTLSTAGKRA